MQSFHYVYILESRFLLCNFQEGKDALEEIFILSSAAGKNAISIFSPPSRHRHILCLQKSQIWLKMKKPTAPKSHFILPCQPGGDSRGRSDYGGIKEIAVPVGCSNWKKQHFKSFSKVNSQ